MIHKRGKNKQEAEIGGWQFKASLGREIKTCFKQ
jgi:hypothetical protein